MKTAHALIRFGAFFGATILAAHADNNAAPASSAPAPAGTPAVSPQGPWLQSFPPAPSSTLDAPTYSSSSSDTGSASGGSSGGESSDAGDAEHVAEQTYLMYLEKKDHPDETSLDQVAKQQAYAKDWMLRSYTDQLKKHGLEKADYTNPFLVPEPLDPTKPQLTGDPLLAPPDKKTTKTKTARPLSPFDDASTLTPKKSLAPLAFQPLLAPLISPVTAPHPETISMAGLDEMASPDSGNSLLPVPNGRSGDNLNGDGDNALGSLLDVPGLTAATQGGIAPNNAIDFEAPPRGSADRAGQAGRDNFLVPTAPASDVSEFFKKQAEALAPPTAPGAVATVMLPTKPHVFVDPQPMAKPAVSGLRSHVADPFDILQR
jgi:hypothetical protein